MPLVRLETTEKLADEARARLCAELSRTAADLIGKPETYVMAVVTDGVTMQHAGTLGSAAFIDVRSIGGLSPRVNKGLSDRLCKLVGAATQVPADRIYLNFTDVAASAWGHDGRTFG